MRPADCHPEVVHYARGLCKQCYMRKYIRRPSQCHPDRKSHGSGRCHRCYQRQRAYGLSREEYHLLAESQGFRCAVCAEEETALDGTGKPKDLGVDHDHKTGRVRGLLCARCNTAIGLMRDEPLLLRTAADYLEAPPLREDRS